MAPLQKHWNTRTKRTRKRKDFLFGGKSLRARKVRRGPRETAKRALGRSAPESVFCRFAQRAQGFRRGAARRNDSHPEENHCVAGLVPVRCFPVLRGTCRRQKADVVTCNLGGTSWRPDVIITDGRFDKKLIDKKRRPL